MKRGLFVFYLSVGALIVALSFYGYSLLRQRPGLAHEIRKSSVIEIENTRIVKSSDIDFALLEKKIGEKIRVVVLEGGQKESLEITLIPYYSRTQAPIIYLIISLFCIGIGVLVFVLRCNSRKARVYYWLSLIFSYSLLINSGFYLAKKDWFSHVPAVLFYLLFPLAAALLLHFAFQHTPGPWRIRKIYSFFILYMPSFIFAGLMVTLYFSVLRTSSIETFHLYIKVLNALRFYLLLYVSLAVGHLIHLYMKIFLEEQRAQIKWVIFGLAAGLSPFLFLFLVPLILGSSPLISEELSNIFFIVIPVSFFFSIVKYKLLKVELVLNRSLVYGLLTVFTVGIYLFFVRLLENFAARWFAVDDLVVSGMAALLSASLFHPARKKIQNFVDKSFFRLSYDYKKNILSFMESAQKIIKPKQLAELFLSKIDRTLPLESAGLLVFSSRSGRTSTIFRKNWKISYDTFIKTSLNENSIYFRKSAVRTEEGIDFSLENLLYEKEMEALFPLRFQITRLTGMLILGKKKSAERYSGEDIELLQSLSRQFALNLERIQLQEEVFLEKAEKDKLDELNKLKTEFITSVSHEIRTPMNSIQGLTEILTEGRVTDLSKRQELLLLIGNECGRLSRFLHNILDFGKIETQTKQYNFKDTDVRIPIQETLQFYKPRFDAEGFVIETEIPSEPVLLNIDSDALKQVLTNLFDNAIKYSKEEKAIRIQILPRIADVEIKITDKGIGISTKDQKKIFDNFFRSPEAATQFPEGVGLGLKIVKHIMDAHNGKIELASQPGEGSAFSMIFHKQ